MMMPNSPRREQGRAHFRAAIASGCLLVSTLAPSAASAALGEDGSTVDQDVMQLRAQRNVTRTAAYAVHELAIAGGTQVREYLTPGNRVFAVTWKGPSIPDLTQLLGTFYPRYLAAAGAIPAQSRRPIALEQPDLVIRAGGHPRAFFGMAYLPQHMPAGMTAEQIR